MKPMLDMKKMLTFSGKKSNTRIGILSSKFTPHASKIQIADS